MATYSSTNIASTYFQVKAGGDAAALKGIAKALLQMDDDLDNVLDSAFIAEHTQNFPAFADDLRLTRWHDIERESGLTRDDLQRVAAAYAKSNATIVTYGMGITQHNKGTSNVRLIAGPAADARQYWQTGRRDLSAARALQRAGQPHRWDHRKAERQLPRQPAA
ncbi:Formate dehydrogenase H [Raoultella terrigena]|uniref:Formate dehydrogenase H n=1 Tax=Raoultella terrigena TaxID=577 RepID=A0A4U9CU18_RAOTE|nr:Formate dehydrogenase H [Raoultella terrigena]